VASGGGSWVRRFTAPTAGVPGVMGIYILSFSLALGSRFIKL